MNSQSFLLLLQIRERYNNSNNHNSSNRETQYIFCEADHKMKELEERKRWTAKHLILTENNSERRSSTQKVKGGNLNI